MFIHSKSIFSFVKDREVTFWLSPLKGDAGTKFVWHPVGGANKFLGCGLFFSFVSSRFVIANWSLFVMVALKSSSEMLTPVLYQGWCLLSLFIWDFPGSWRWVIFYWKLDILSIMFWILFKSCFSRPSMTGEGRATHYQLGVEIQVLYLALTDSHSKERERHLGITGLY